jgi:dTDP-4-dehydrorhamnose reductase
MTGSRGNAPPAPAAGGAVLPLELWAGLECTINRIGESFRDQLEYAGHYARLDDIERLADLGVRTVRYPVLWERHADNRDQWAFTDRALELFRRRDIDVIAGLVHHGSGPRHTSLLDPDFARGLASFARRVAERYPWLRRFTPVNEPLTTARFAALYGHWYPHKRSEEAMVCALVHQVRGVQLAMQAIGEVIPDAQLVQTEDLGFTHSTPTLRYQADFENERRWLTFDLLEGRVKAGHPFWKRFSRDDAVATELARIADDAADPRARPALLGVNHYLTSERFLDDRIGDYPRHLHGGNGRHRYVDVEAVRVLEDGPLGPAQLLEQVWHRYGKPIAVTEAHLACTREQQMRWLHDMWTEALQARKRGAQVVAVTAWSALGAFDWRSLLTREEMVYESGLYDVRAPAPRETALVPMVRSLATLGYYDHPALEASAWWKRNERILHRHAPAGLASDGPVRATAPRARARPLLITGAGGTLGRAFMLLAEERGLRHAACTRRDLDISDREQVVAVLDRIRPWAVVNTAGWVRVDQAEHDVDGCMRANATGAQLLAEECAARGIAFVTFSSDLVFSGRESRPWIESDAPKPLNVYGRSKVESEQLVLSSMPEALVVRTSAFFGDWDDWNFVSRSLAILHAGGRVRAPDDAIVSPTYVSDLVHATLDLLIDDERGVWHLANVGALSWNELARHAAREAGLDAARIERCNSSEIGWTAPRPNWSVLGSERATLLSPVDDAIARYLKSRAWERVARSLRHAGDAGHHGPGVRAAHFHATT